MLEPILYEVRDNYLNHPTLASVDTFKQPGSSCYKVEVQYLTADPLDDTCIKANASWTVNEDGTLTRDGNSTIQQDSILIQKYSPSGKFKAVLKNVGEATIIEIYKNGLLWFRKPVPTSVHLGPIKHALFIADQMVFSQNESRFMYVADDTQPQASVYKLKDAGVKKNKYFDSLGDGVQGHRHPSVMVFDLESRELVKIRRPEQSTSSRLVFIQPQFADIDGTIIVCVQLDMVGATDQVYFMNYPKKLVLISGLEISNAKEIEKGFKEWKVEPEILNGNEGVSQEVACLPRVSPDFLKVSYFFNQKCLLPALNNCGLRVIDLKTRQVVTLIEEQEEDDPIFTGINGFHLSLNTYSWMTSTTLVFSSIHHQTAHLYEVDISLKKVARLNQSHRHLPSESTSFLAKLGEGIFLAKRDCLQRNGLLSVWRKNETGAYSEVGSEDIEAEDKEFEYFDEHMDVGGIEGRLYGRDGMLEPGTERPLVVLIHGGPHGSSMNVRHPLFHLLAKNGAILLNVNYTGSWGRGNKFARGLCGKSWEIEAEEVKGFIDKLVVEKRCDPSQIKVFGGSYGGYIALGLLHRYPDLISHTSIFNPVVNGFSMFVGSTYYNFVLSSMLGEIEGEFKFNRKLTDEECLTIMKKSPVFADFKFKGQVVFFTGLKDDMVPPLSTRSLFKRLRAQGLQVQLYEYPTEEHFITTIGPNFDFCVKTAILFAGLLPQI